MSHTAHIRSHRKPRRSASTIAMRAGVASGVLGTLAVATAAGTANAAEPVTQTLELPVLTGDLAAQVAQSAQATQQAAANYQLQAERDAAATAAAKEAKKDLADAKAEAKKKAEAARKAAAERATRAAERTTLTSTSSSSSSSSDSTSSSTATGSAAAVIAFVKAQIGDAYVSGGTGPNSWDCSGLMQTAFKQVGVDLPRVSQDQSTFGTQVSLDNLLPGDILYWGSAGSAYHVAVYVGDGMFVGAQNPSTGVAEKPLSYDPPTGAVRVL